MWSLFFNWVGLMQELLENHFDEKPNLTLIRLTKVLLQVCSRRETRRNQITLQLNNPCLLG